MKIAMPSAAQAHMQAWSRPTATTLFRLTGLLIAVSVPTGFWTFALMLATSLIRGLSEMHEWFDARGS